MTVTNDVFVIACLFVTLRAAITVKAVSISNVDVKNMGNCENSNEKLMFFDTVNSRSKMKNSVFYKKPIKPEREL